MAAPAATVTAHSAIGNREDLAEAIYDISPMDTYFLSTAAHTAATAVSHEWQTDALDAAADNAHIEGDDATANTFTPTTRVNNRCQISRKTVSVSGTQRSVNSAGRADELSYQLVKRGRELKRDMERALVQNGASTGGGASSARALAGLESWLATNKTHAGSSTGATTPGFSSGTVAAPTDATNQGTFTEAILKDVIAKCWTSGGDPRVVMVGSFNKRQASGFAGVAPARRDTGDDRVKIIGAADVYLSDFGECMIVPNRYQRDRTAFVLDFEYLKVAFLRDIHSTPLAKTGDADREMILAEYTLEVCNEAASGKATDLTTS